jgi:hypothetical protein
MASLNAARDQNNALQAEVDTMRVDYAGAQGEVVALKDQLIRQQQENNARMNKCFSFLLPPHLHLLLLHSLLFCLSQLGFETVFLLFCSVQTMLVPFWA